MELHHDYSDVTRLDDHFAERRAEELKLEAEAQRTQQEAQLIPLRNERIRKMGLAALTAGAGIGLACFGASFLIVPLGHERIVIRDVPGPERVVTKEVPGPERVVIKEVPGPERVVTKEVPGPERVVIKEVPGPERVVPGPERVIPDAPVPLAPDTTSQYCSTMDGKGSYPCNSLDRPTTPEEKKFVEKPEYKDAVYRGRIVKSRDGHKLSFEDGKDFHPAHWDDAAGKVVTDDDAVIDSDPYVGDLGMCVEEKDHKDMWDCTAMHNGVETAIGRKSKGATPAAAPQPPCLPSPSVSKNGLPILVPRPGSCAPQPPAKSAGVAPAMDMVNVDVDVAGYQVKATVDTGCSFPMAIPTALATALLHDGRAIFAGMTKTMLADGKKVDVGVILIKSITVDGRTLDSVEASVSPSNSAPILLGLSALNRLGPFTIDNGRIVFTSDQPT
jgi:hypothetical protein